MNEKIPSEVLEQEWWVLRNEILGNRPPSFPVGDKESAEKKEKERLEEEDE